MSLGVPIARIGTNRLKIGTKGPSFSKLHSLILSYLHLILPNSHKPKHNRKVDIKGDMKEPLKSTQLIVIREQWRPRVPEGGKNPNRHGSWRLAHQNDRLEAADQILGLIEPKSDTSIHQNCQLIAAAGSQQRRQVTVKGDHLAEESEMRGFKYRNR